MIGSPSLAVLAAIAGSALAVTRRWVVRVEVRGSSMTPVLVPGDRVLAVRTPLLRPGDIVAALDPRRPSRLLVKRIAAVLPGDYVELLGDHRRASTDSRVFGPVPRELVAGRVVWRYWPPHRRGAMTGDRRPEPIR